MMAFTGITLYVVSQQVERITQHGRSTQDNSELDAASRNHHRPIITVQVAVVTDAVSMNSNTKAQAY